VLYTHGFRASAQRIRKIHGCKPFFSRQDSVSLKAEERFTTLFVPVTPRWNQNLARCVWPNHVGGKFRARTTSAAVVGDEENALGNFANI
jgi:hypothetical protein